MYVQRAPTKNHYWKIEDTKIIESMPHALGMIPIFEYPANNARLGAFEIVLPLLDAFNNVDSNRLDGVEQFVQALMLFHNVDITSDDYAKLRLEGAIKFKDIDPQYKAEIDYLTAELNQTQTQALIDEHLFERLANHKVGTFDVDQLFDYTGHRPPIVFDRDHFRQYGAPEIALHALSDSQGNSFLLLSGPEPALQWERMAASVERLTLSESIISALFYATVAFLYLNFLRSLVYGSFDSRSAFISLS